jgi:AcrR family transcriptional regulator
MAKMRSSAVAKAVGADSPADFPADAPADSPAGGPAKVGRKRDPSRDEAILQAALDVLAEVGYAGMTIDLVATRAKAGKATVYRRWSSKEEMVLEAVARTRPGVLSLDDLPDTGTLRGDLLALFTPQPRREVEKRMKVMAGLASMALTHPGFDEAVNDTMVVSWAEAYRALMQRAMGRGEIAQTADIDTICEVIPSVAAYRALIRRKSFERDFLTTWIDGVVLPALLHGRAAEATGQ